jgi:hypothetical protein
MIILLFTIIIIKYINDNKDNFININDFNLKDKRTDVDKLKDDDIDFIILLFNTLLKTIIKKIR